MGFLVGIFVPLFFFLTVVGLTALIVRATSKRNTQRHEEAIAMIEKGIYEPPPVLETVYRKERYLLWGIILTGLGVAFLLSFALLSEHGQGLAIAGLVALCPGLGLVAFYFVLARREEREREPGRLTEDRTRRELGQS